MLCLHSLALSMEYPPNNLQRRTSSGGTRKRSGSGFGEQPLQMAPANSPASFTDRASSPPTTSHPQPPCLCRFSSYAESTTRILNLNNDTSIIIPNYLTSNSALYRRTPKTWRAVFRHAATSPAKPQCRATSRVRNETRAPSPGEIKNSGPPIARSPRVPRSSGTARGRYRSPRDGSAGIRRGPDSRRKAAGRTPAIARASRWLC